MPGTHLARATATNLRYLLSVDADSLLYAWRQSVGLDTRRARPYGGWEHPGAELRGHFLGHYLTAAANAWATTHDAALEGRMRYVVRSLSE